MSEPVEGWREAMAALTQPGDAEKAKELYDLEAMPEDGPDQVYIAALVDGKETLVAGPMTALQALYATIPFHHKYERLKFIPV